MPITTGNRGKSRTQAPKKNHRTIKEINLSYDKNEYWRFASRPKQVEQRRAFANAGVTLHSLPSILLMHTVSQAKQGLTSGPDRREGASSDESMCRSTGIYCMETKSRGELQTSYLSDIVGSLGKILASAEQRIASSKLGRPIISEETFIIEGRDQKLTTRRPDAVHFTLAGTCSMIFQSLSCQHVNNFS